MKTSAVWFGIALVGALAVHYMRPAVPVGWIMFGILVVLPLGGLLITLDDDLPGGWSNPDGTVPPPWMFRDFWGVLLLRISMSWVGFAIDHGWNTSDGAIYWATAIVGAVLGVALIRTAKPVRVDK